MRRSVFVDDDEAFLTEREDPREAFNDADSGDG